MSETTPPSPDASLPAASATSAVGTAGGEGLPRTAPAAAQSQSGAPAGEASALSTAALRQLERICEHLGADPQRSPQMARQLVKRAGQLARERDWSEAQALEHLLGLLLKASGSGEGPQTVQ